MANSMLTTRYNAQVFPSPFQKDEALWLLYQSCHADTALTLRKAGVLADSSQTIHSPPELVALGFNNIASGRFNRIGLEVALGRRAQNGLHQRVKVGLLQR